jgi:hypothetical protein
LKTFNYFYIVSITTITNDKAMPLPSHEFECQPYYYYCMWGAGKNGDEISKGKIFIRINVESDKLNQILRGQRER